MKKLENMDKLKHFGAGAVIVVAASYVMGGGLIGVKSGVVACALIALVKELYDAQGDGTPDGADFVSTVAGGLTSAVLML